MRLHEINPKGSRIRNRKRVGRGIAAGGGKTAGRGTKGKRSRSGEGKNPGFEGGQTPYHMRAPKLRGFKVKNRVENQPINLGKLESLGLKEVDPQVLAERKVIDPDGGPLKVLGTGEVKSALTVKAHAFSKTAEEKILAAGGKIEILL